MINPSITTKSNACSSLTICSLEVLKRDADALEPATADVDRLQWGSCEIDSGQLALRKIDFLQFAGIKIGFIQATVLVTDILLLAESQSRHLQVAFPEEYIFKDAFSHRGTDKPAIHEADTFHRHFIQLHIGEIAAFEDDIPQVQLRNCRFAESHVLESDFGELHSSSVAEVNGSIFEEGMLYVRFIRIETVGEIFFRQIFWHYGFHNFGGHLVHSFLKVLLL
jgi:hypothetical protein